ncbi:MAG TPA: TonB family protein [Bryobacteraceae bacterium]|nr:TonB family protein [Bryobacteraceae bacterium]
MTPHVDILEGRERMSGYFAGSLMLHISVAAGLLVFGHLDMSSKVPLMGDPHGGGFGSVTVTPTATIPLPPKTGPANPVANDTQSHVPTPPPKTKQQAKAKAPEPDAVLLRSRNAARREMERDASQSNRWREQQKDLPNQVYSPAGQSVSSPMYNIQGGGGVGVGNNSPFGTQFGWYATALRDKVAQNWKPTDISSRSQTAPAAVVTFTIRKDGSVAPNSIKISQSSGNRALDFSAQRAVLDSVPFQPLPAGFPRSEAAVELRFELRR